MTSAKSSTTPADSALTGSLNVLGMHLKCSYEVRSQHLYFNKNDFNHYCFNKTNFKENAIEEFRPLLYIMGTTISL